MEYNYNINSKVVLSISDIRKYEYEIEETYNVKNSDEIINIMDIINITQTQKFDILLNVEYFQIPDNGENNEYELVKTETLTCFDYYHFMHNLTYVFSQDRVYELKYWNK
jgi:hypothetical protein